MKAWRMFFSCCFFFFNDTATTEIYTLPLHDALPISRQEAVRNLGNRAGSPALPADLQAGDRKSTRLNSRHITISYADFCLKKQQHKTLLRKTNKKKQNIKEQQPNKNTT